MSNREFMLHLNPDIAHGFRGVLYGADLDPCHCSDYDCECPAFVELTSVTGATVDDVLSNARVWIVNNGYENPEPWKYNYGSKFTLTAERFLGLPELFTVSQVRKLIEEDLSVIEVEKLKSIAFNFDTMTSTIQESSGKIHRRDIVT